MENKVQAILSNSLKSIKIPYVFPEVSNGAVMCRNWNRLVELRNKVSLTELEQIECNLRIGFQNEFSLGNNQDKTCRSILDFDDMVINEYTKGFSRVLK